MNEDEKMTCEEFLVKVNSEGLGYALTSYFGPNVELKGPGASELAAAWKLASLAVKYFEEAADKLADKHGWEMYE